MAWAQYTMAGTCEWSSYDFSRNSWTGIAFYLWHKQQCPRLGKHHVIKPHKIHRVTEAFAGKPHFSLHFPSDVESSFYKVTIITKLPRDRKTNKCISTGEKNSCALKEKKKRLFANYLFLTNFFSLSLHFSEQYPSPDPLGNLVSWRNSCLI